MKHKLITGNETKTGSVQQNMTPEDKTYKTNQESNILPAKHQQSGGLQVLKLHIYF